MFRQFNNLLDYSDVSGNIIIAIKQTVRRGFELEQENNTRL